MIFKETKLRGSFIIELEKINDDRGFFARAFCKKEFETHGLISNFVQSNISYNIKKNTIRGIHYQVAPFQEIKLGRCTKGAMYDIIIDLRPESSTYKQWIGVELNTYNSKMIYIPEGFAHGYQALMDNTEFFYHTSQFYSPEHERGIRWDDPLFAIEWPIDVNVITDKDRNWPDYLP